MTDPRALTPESGLNAENLENLMERLREGIRRRRHRGSETEEDSPPIDTLATDEPQTIVSSMLLSGVQTATKTHDTLAAGISSLPRTRLKSWIGPWFVRIVYFYARWQVQWNAVVADVLGMFLNAIDRIEARFVEVQRRLEDTSKRLGCLEQESERLSSVQVPQRPDEERRETSEMFQRIISMESRCQDMQARLAEAESKQQESARHLERLENTLREQHTWKTQV